MTLEELWKSLEPQAQAMEEELLAREVMFAGMDFSAAEEAVMNAILTGHGIYMTGAENRLTGRDPGIVIADEIDTTIRSEGFERLIEKLKTDPYGQMKVIILGHADQLPPFGDIGGARRRAGMAGVAALAMAECMETFMKFMDVPQPPPGDPWHPKALSKKNYAAPRQSFRVRMRSVNRNR